MTDRAGPHPSGPDEEALHEEEAAREGEVAREREVAREEEAIAAAAHEAAVREAARRVRARARKATWAAAIGVAALALLTTLPFVEVLALPAFYLLLPGLAIAQLPILEVERLERIPVYLGSIATILVLGAVSLVLGLRLEVAAPAGFGLLPAREMLAWTLALTAAGLAVIALFRPLEDRAGGGRRTLLRELLPRTRRERRVFAGLSLSAGVGEELAYRGYAYQAAQLLGAGPWGAALASSVPFGFLHAYQGPVGVARTAAMGFVLAVPVVVTGSLLPSMAAHALLDLVIGLLLGPRLISAEADAGTGRGSGGTDLVPADPDR